MRVRVAATLAGVLLLAAGCGSGGGGGGGSSSADAARIVPADALAYVAIGTDLGSSQLASAKAIIAKFPITAQLLQRIHSSASKQGVDVTSVLSSLGSDVELAVLQVNGKTNAVGFAKPKDESTFDAQLAKSKAIHETIDGWTVFSDKQPFIDAVKNRTGSLMDDPAFKAAQKTLPEDAIATFYASSAGLQTALQGASTQVGPAAESLGSFTSGAWTAGALTSQDDAFKLEVHSKTTGTKAPASAALSSEIPGGSIVALQIAGGGSIPANVRSQLGAMSQQLGVDLASLLGVLNGPAIAYVRPGLPIPEVTLAARPAQPAEAKKAVGQLIARFANGAKPVPTPVDGGTLDKVDLGPVSLYYGVNGGQLVVTDSATALSELKGSAGHLTGDAVFKEAKDGAGLPDSGQGFLFVDLKDALPAVSGIAQLANQSLPPQVEQNLRPLRSLLVFGSKDGDLQSFVAYLKTS
jgi:hypothetical protein